LSSCFKDRFAVASLELCSSECFVDNRWLRWVNHDDSAPVNTLRTALVPGLVAGVISVFGSWLWMGVVFHRFQKETPDTWRSEGPLNYVGASLLHLLAALGIACLVTLIVRFNVAFFAAGLAGSLRFAVCLWGAISLPMILGLALFVRLHPLVVIGQLLDWLTTLVVASLLTGWWLGS
jgi:hypothetical protein